MLKRYLLISIVFLKLLIRTVKAVNEIILQSKIYK